MDPDRHLPIPGHKHPPAMLSPSASEPQARPIAPSAVTYQPSLPSIRQLHPYLPPSSSTSSHLPQDSPPYSYAPPSGFAGPSGSTDFHPGQPVPSRGTVHPRSEGLDSEQEGEAEHTGPAKKKRRRQALSCNECKRRKIKCDRAQPCGPCTRRGEQSKCQWRTLEPVDKYVTRAEYDELKARSKADYDQLKAKIDRLEAIVAPFVSASPAPLYSMSSDMSGAPPPEGMSYPAGHPSSSGPVLYAPAMPPSSTYSDPALKPPHYPSSSPRLVTPTTLPPPTSPQPPPGGGGGNAPGHARRTSTSDTKSPTTVRQSPLSLASITSPFNTEQPKNYRAQTPHTPGGRLRPVLPHLPLRRDGPATLRCGTPPWSTRTRRRALRTLPSKAWGFICPDHRRADDMANRV